MDMLIIDQELKKKVQGHVYKMALKVTMRAKSGKKPSRSHSVWVSAAGVCHPPADCFSLRVICLLNSERTPERISAKKALKASHH